MTATAAAAAAAVAESFNIQYTSLYGSGSTLSDLDRPYGSLLEINACHILLDCGWTPTFDTYVIDALTK